MKKVPILLLLLTACQYLMAQNVGIGITIPTARLHVADSNVLFSANGLAVGTPGNPPLQGAGRRMMWYADKAAFRAGYVEGNDWDKNNIGNYSLATGANTVASGTYSTAMGFGTTASGFSSVAIGRANTSSGFNSTTIGLNATASGDYSTAMGNYVNTNNHEGTFLIGDRSTTTVMFATTPNNFRARFDGCYRFYTSSDYSSSCALSPGANAWSTTSDVHTKENFAAVNGEDFLKKISGFHLTSWNYKTQNSKTFRHYGPMAQDFYAAFGKDKYGTIGNDTTINSADFAGVSFIAIQALEKRTAMQQHKMEENTGALKKEIEHLKVLILQLRKELNEMKNGKH
jgi:Chaperone of endosialidase/Head domain of trimeric autotransporter adhesin